MKMNENWNGNYVQGKNWNWDKKKKKAKVSQDGVTTYKLNKKELDEYLASLKHKEIKIMKSSDL